MHNRVQPRLYKPLFVDELVDLVQKLVIFVLLFRLFEFGGE